MYNFFVSKNAYVTQSNKHVTKFINNIRYAHTAR